MANEQSQSNAHKGNHKLAKTYNFFQEALTIAIVLFISKIIESFIPFLCVSNRTRITIHPIMHWCGQIRSS